MSLILKACYSAKIPYFAKLKPNTLENTDLNSTRALYAEEFHGVCLKPACCQFV